MANRKPRETNETNEKNEYADTTAQHCLRNATTGQILLARLEVARGAGQRAVGLIGRAALAPDAGLWLQPCNGVHTFGMRFAIDVLFLDRQGRVLRVACGLRPCRICGPVWKARTVVELPAGAATRLAIAVGARLEAVRV